MFLFFPFRPIYRVFRTRFNELQAMIFVILFFRTAKPQNGERENDAKNKTKKNKFQNVLELLRPCVWALMHVPPSETWGYTPTTLINKFRLNFAHSFGVVFARFSEKLYVNGLRSSSTFIFLTNNTSACQLHAEARVVLLCVSFTLVRGCSRKWTHTSFGCFWRAIFF